MSESKFDGPYIIIAPYRMKKELNVLELSKTFPRIKDIDIDVNKKIKVRYRNRGMFTFGELCEILPEVKKLGLKRNDEIYVELDYDFKKEIINNILSKFRNNSCVILGAMGNKNLELAHDIITFFSELKIAFEEDRMEGVLKNDGKIVTEILLQKNSKLED